MQESRSLINRVNKTHNYGQFLVKLLALHYSFLTEANTPIPYGSEGSDFQLIEGDNTLRFAVKLIANMNQITVGEFYSVINFTISYQ